MDKSFPMLSANAAHKIAKRTRMAFVLGQMDSETFLVKRAKQEIVAHNRFEIILSRIYPNHKADILIASVGAGGVLTTRPRPDMSRPAGKMEAV
jgi:hypothetical protein